MKTHTCPVCGYNELEDPPEPGTVCPCCGTEFGYDDEDLSTAELRGRWIRDGARWWSPEVPAPPGWEPVAQLRNVGYTPTSSEMSRIAARSGKR
jgi:hypothetical protein